MQVCTDFKLNYSSYSQISLELEDMKFLEFSFVFHNSTIMKSLILRKLSYISPQETSRDKKSGGGRVDLGNH